MSVMPDPVLIVFYLFTDTCCLDLGLDIRMPSYYYSNDTGRLPCTTPSLDQVGIRLESVVALTIGAAGQSWQKKPP